MLSALETLSMEEIKLNQEDNPMIEASIKALTLEDQLLAYDLLT